MVGKGANIKSLAYVENLSNFLVYCLDNPKSSATYNYVDTPNLKVIDLIKKIYSTLGRKYINVHVPVIIGLTLGKLLDVVSFLSGVKLPISYIRIKKFCANSDFEDNLPNDFTRPHQLNKAISRTILYEIENFNK
jgi:nucleoside-diphosphate-sugar epimerase